MADKKLVGDVLDAVKQSPEYAAVVGAGIALQRDVDKADLSDRGSKESDRVSTLHNVATEAYIKRVYSELGKKPGYENALKAYDAAMKGDESPTYTKIHEAAMKVREKADQAIGKMVEAASQATLGNIDIESQGATQSLPCLKGKGGHANCR